MNVKWTLLSKEDYFKNIEYLEIYWTEKEVVNFIEKVDYCINLLANENVIFTKSDFDDVYKMIVIKQITLYYSIIDNTIFLMRFWNNYQDLKKFKL